ncbi:hypothetical protein PIB30_101563 [Stylosanthes scabra]|uniref:Uncharacterized protein n=1 Tax=Stylosanthes scabra TaxID=79078 RepID=A0ABU6YWG0_9FABA|nr:hypothetical protein [Stylosanthes scabra]
MGRNGVKSVTAIRTPLLARVRALRHEFNMVPRCMSCGLVTAGSTEFFQPQVVDCRLLAMRAPLDLFKFQGPRTVTLDELPRTYRTGLIPPTRPLDRVCFRGLHDNHS